MNHSQNLQKRKPKQAHIMEKVGKNSFFPPLVIPEAYMRKKASSNLSKEGQRVMNEMEQRQIYHEMLRKRICIEFDAEQNAVQENLVNDTFDDFCIACTQRVSIQPIKRPTTRNRRKMSRLPKDSIKGCICILCKKPLPLSPQEVGNHHILVNNSVQVVKNEHQEKLESNYRREAMKKLELQADFQISAPDYDSRLDALQSKPEIEQCMPPREVMRRSERKCQLWLLKNEEHLKAEVLSRYGTK